MCGAVLFCAVLCCAVLCCVFCNTFFSLVYFGVWLSYGCVLQTTNILLSVLEFCLMWYREKTTVLSAIPAVTASSVWDGKDGVLEAMD
jgi:hypothetical protein